MRNRKQPKLPPVKWTPWNSHPPKVFPFRCGGFANPNRLAWLATHFIQPRHSPRG